MVGDPFTDFLTKLANGGGTDSSGQPKPIDVQSVFSSLFNTGDNTPKPVSPLDSPVAPPTAAAGIAQGFHGITQGFEGINTTPRSDTDEGGLDDFWSMLSLFT